VLNAGIFSPSVFPNQHGVHVVVWSLVSLDRYARPNVSEKIERATKSQVERNMAFADWVTVSTTPKLPTNTKATYWV
jgi:hypothetical protein